MGIRRIKSVESGSIAPLGIGLASLTLATVLAVASASSAYLTDRRLTAIAESTAYAVLLASEQNQTLWLEYFAKEFLDSHPQKGVNQLSLESVSVSDGATVRVRLCSKFEPFVINYVFSDVGTICSEGLARRGR